MSVTQKLYEEALVTIIAKTDKWTKKVRQVNEEGRVAKMEKLDVEYSCPG